MRGRCTCAGPEPEYPQHEWFCGHDPEEGEPELPEEPETVEDLLVDAYKQIENLQDNLDMALRSIVRLRTAKDNAELAVITLTEQGIKHTEANNRHIARLCEIIDHYQQPWWKRRWFR